jgi:hypothetical protein
MFFSQTQSPNLRGEETLLPMFPSKSQCALFPHSLPFLNLCREDIITLQDPHRITTLSIAAPLPVSSTASTKPPAKETPAPSKPVTKPVS